MRQRCSAVSSRPNAARPRWARWLIVMAAALALALPGAAVAAPPPGTPNSAASRNCVATSSGVLFYRQTGKRLGEDVRQFAPHGGQAAYIQSTLAKDCGG